VLSVQVALNSSAAPFTVLTTDPLVSNTYDIQLVHTTPLAHGFGADRYTNGVWGVNQRIPNSVIVRRNFTFIASNNDGQMFALFDDTDAGMGITQWTYTTDGGGTWAETGDLRVSS
jgi:hypothetical protein